MFDQRHHASAPGWGWRWLCKHVSPSNRAAVLLAWATIHTTVIWALIGALDSEVGRAYAKAGLQATAVQLLAVLLTCNTLMYLSIWVSDPGFVSIQGSAQQQWMLQQPTKLQEESSDEHCSDWQLSTQPCTAEACHTSPAGKQRLKRAAQRRGSSGGGSSSSSSIDTDEQDALCRDSDDVEVAGSAQVQHGRRAQCQHCSGIVPLRSRHCRHCARCIRGFDHHCFWVGTCIGANNHVRFWVFLGTQTALLAWGVHQALTALRHQAQNPAAAGRHSRQQLLAAALTMFQLLVFLVVGGLLLLHSMLMVLNQTTFEAFERTRVSYLAHLPHDMSPFDKGPLLNVWHFFFARDAYDSLADWRQAPGQQDLSLTMLLNNDWYSCC